jgi:N-methylhydantoinase A
MVERVMGVMREDEVPDEKVELRYEAALQYEGQTHRVMITLPSADISVDGLTRAFSEEYRERYGVTVDNVPIRLVNLRVRASAPRNIDVSIDGDAMRGSNANGAHTSPIFFSGSWHDARIHHRGALKKGAVVEGPARIDQADTTTIVPPGWTARVDELGNIAITHEAFAQ